MKSIKLDKMRDTTKPPIVFIIDLGSINNNTVIRGIDESGETCYYTSFCKPLRETTNEIQALNSIYPSVIKLINNTGVNAMVVERLIYDFKIDNIIPF